MGVLAGMQPIKLHCPLPPGRGVPTRVPDEAELLAVVRRVFSVTAYMQEREDGRPFDQGCFNSIYMLRLEKPVNTSPITNVPERILVRIAGDIKTSSDISLESEVATMTYLKEHTSIPVPDVYAYCTEEVNSVGRPFIVMSHMPGVCVSSHEWENFSLECKLRTVRGYAKVVTELAGCKFDKIGSLYYTQSLASRSSSASSPVTYVVGPISWPKMRSDIRRNLPVYNRGPWSSASHWITAALEDELQLMQFRPDIAIEAHGILDESIEESFPEARKYFTAMLREVPAVTDDPWSAGPFYLSHADLAPPNILIEPAGPNAGAITAVVDWEMASTVPLWGLVCYPQWFRKEVPWCDRDEATARALEEAYASEMRHLGHCEEVIRLIKKDGWRRGFIEIAVQPWLAADLAEDWLKNNGRRH